MRRLMSGLGAAVVLAATVLAQVQSGARGFHFEIVVPASVESKRLDGRVLLIVARTNETAPMNQVGRGLTSQPLFGIDVEGLKPGQPAVIDGATRGWPLESISQIPPGEYWVQAVLNVYTTFQRADGHTIKAHMDQWEGQRWNRSPGNLYSEPQKVRLDPSSSVPVRISLAQRILPIEPAADTKYVKHLKFKSEILSKWWGHDMYLGAVVVLPEGFEEHPNAHYPVVYNQGHFPRTFSLGEPGAPSGRGGQVPSTGSGRVSASGSPFYQDWVSGKLGRFIIVLMQHPTPFYDDSYAVNSANNGPYGDALTQELMGLVERRFRAIAEPWARTLYGGSTGGWESLAWQIFYPDMFNGTWTFCPDPVDFRYFQMVNIYQDTNAFYPNSAWKTESVRPWQRGVDDQVMMSQKDASHLEEVLGTRGRSGDQMDIFFSVYGPVGADGYPKLLYDKWTGVIDKSVAEYWREHYDLVHILRRDWATLGPKLRGKLHLYVGDMDTYYLEEAALLLQKFLEGTTDPYYAGSFDIGARAPHCYSGKPEFPGQRAEQRVFPQMLERILKTAPPGADVTSWRY